MMKGTVQKAGKAALGVILACGVVLGLLYLDHDIGVRKSGLEEDIRSSQKINEDWTVAGEASGTLAAYISYPEDQSDHVFSLYVNRPGLSFGYFFRAGGSLGGVEEYIMECTVEGYHERAFVSMNKPKVERLEVDGGNAKQVIEIDSGRPFALVLPVNAGEVTFFGADGTAVEFYRHQF